MNNESSKLENNEKRKLDYLIPILIFPIIMISLLFFTLPTNVFIGILNFPFSIIHEIGHFIFMVILIPEGKPEFSFNFFSVTPPYVVVTPSSENWKMLLIYLSGPLIVSVITIFLLHMLKRSNYRYTRIIKYYLYFGLLNQLPNLLPVLPEHVNMMTMDGYGVYSNLSTYLLFPPISESLSILLLLLLLFCGLLSFYFLGLLVYEYSRIKKNTIREKKT